MIYHFQRKETEFVFVQRCKYALRHRTPVLHNGVEYRITEISYTPHVEYTIELTRCIESVSNDT